MVYLQDTNISNTNIVFFNSKEVQKYMNYFSSHDHLSLTKKKKKKERNLQRVSVLENLYFKDINHLDH